MQLVTILLVWFLLTAKESDRQIEERLKVETTAQRGKRRNQRGQTANSFGDNNNFVQLKNLGKQGGTLPNAKKSKSNLLPSIVQEKTKGDLHLVQPVKLIEPVKKSLKLTQPVVQQPVKLIPHTKIHEHSPIIQDTAWKPTVHLKSKRKPKLPTAAESSSVTEYKSTAKLLSKPPQTRLKSHKQDSMNARMSGVHDSHMSGILDEKILVDLLSNAASRQQALHYIDKNITRNNNLLSLLDRSMLFDQFHRVLADYRSTPHQIQCTMLISKLIPLLNQNEVDACMKKIMTRVVSNIGSNAHKLQRESIQTVHAYMKHTKDFKYIVQSLAYDGLRHKDRKTRHQVLISFPSLLYPEFKHQDFFDIVHTLVLAFDEEEENDSLKKVWKIVMDYLGPQSFNKCIERLPAPLQTFLIKNRIIPSNSNSRNERIQQNDSQDDTDVSIAPSKSIAWSPETVPPPKPRNNSINLDDWSPETKKSQRRVRDSHRQDMEQIENTFGIPFLTKQMLIELASPISTIRLNAVEQVKRILESPEMNAEKLTNCTFTLVSILQSTVRDKNLQIVSTSLSCLQVSTTFNIIFLISNYNVVFLITSNLFIYFTS